MKKTFTLALTLILTAVLAAACGNNNNGNNTAASSEAPSTASASASASAPAAASDKKVVLVTPEKIGVNAFYTQMADALFAAGTDFGVETKVIESTDVAAFEQNLRAAVADKYDLVITASFNAVDALTKVAAENPDTSFAIIDTVVDAPNVRSISFREHEASYLIGALVGLSTKTNTIGVVAAMDIPLIKKYTVGYEEGIKSVNPDATYLTNYVGSFADPAKAKELALLQADKGADFIIGASAVGDSGVFEAAKEKGFFTSGQDVDRTGEDPEHVVLSQLKQTDTVTYETVKDFVAGNFTFGAVDYGLKEDGVGVTYVTTDSQTPLNTNALSQDNIDKVKKIRDDIVSGALIVKDPLAE